ncbi:MAG: hypothetical protein M3Z09_07105 [Acidobacteriota bacterium]|nr:hypothetical protein [Acidobacteriota bacterium]
MVCSVTPELAAKIFPFTSLSNIRSYLPDVAGAMESAGGDQTMLLLALATIRAETESFTPCCEEPSRFNTSPRGKPFDLYDRRQDLGNQGPPDGERFRGRGYVQLTGRSNYAHLGQTLGLELIENPEIAAESAQAARILFEFLHRQEGKLRAAVAQGDLAGARRLVNGGSHGLARFREAFQIGNALLNPS